MSTPLSAKQVSVTVLLCLLGASATGCDVFKRVAGADTIDLTRATVRSMTVEVRRESKTICPREPVQMGVFMVATREGETAEKMYETWIGRANVNKNDRLDFAQFAFQSEQGEFDKNGWFTPTPNLVATTGHEFVVRATFTPQPVVHSYTYKWKPDYSCILSSGTSGLAGSVGSAGPPGKQGNLEASAGS